VYTPLLLQAAAAATALDRLKLTTAWFVAGFQHTFDTWRKPFNPILGETWQSVNSCGCEAFLKQVSHYPPIAAYSVKGSGFHMQGSIELQIQVCAPPNLHAATLVIMFGSKLRLTSSFSTCGNM
jgi:hypothetical protein